MMRLSRKIPVVLTHSSDAERLTRHQLLMARFYFDLHECGHGAVIDEDGLDLPDLAAARVEAIRNAKDVMKGEIDSGHLCLGCAIVIRDDSGADVLAVPFADVLAVTFAGTC